MIIKLGTGENQLNSKEGKLTEQIIIPENSKALYQGTAEINFVIYKYLGVPAEYYYRNTKLDIGYIFEQLQQLFQQIYNLNKNDQFHNDVKIRNCVVYEDGFSFFLSLIDFGSINFCESYMGTFDSLCISACMNWLNKIYISSLQRIMKFKEFKEFNKLKILSKSTDIVGFYNTVIQILLLN